MPGAKDFRDWGRMLWLVNLAVAMLAGAGMRELLRAPQRVVFGIAVGAGGLAVAAVAFPRIGALHRVLATGRDGTIARWSPVVLVLALAGAVFVATLHRRGGTVAILSCARSTSCRSRTSRRGTVSR